ncbi:hypothetical protein DAPPUDRAFT_114517 [Daphnia pulex]|uniref:Strawberry notch AAA domain-containing protein n=1 Tax=Daphnia pulex TaxID=6669 RepID=E9HIE4_DAPPU|nr:hypothetical protein DAPPUDRAFT_114517 [Daphnia pulex]|eukprot:EFX68487.1 hypothetical protein DAPPUDRAFT_114517 [Daphnia pulex]
MASTQSPGPSSRSSRGTPSPSPARRRFFSGENVVNPNTFSYYATFHPERVVETASLASVAPPHASYNLHLPEKTIENSSLSPLQLETIKYACKQNDKILPDGSRAGFFIGDCTGFGKRRMIAGIVFENHQKGRKKAIWVSASSALKYDAERDLRDIGADSIPVYALKEMQYGNISAEIKDGVLFSTYSSLIRESKFGGECNTRFSQLIQWCGEDFDGVIVLDECHRAKNIFPTGSTQPTKTGLRVLELQKKLPNARVIYASATGASEPRHMAYMVRLGLWGKGTPFKKLIDFIEAIEKRGLAALEILAMEMKHRGMYKSEQSSFSKAQFNVYFLFLTLKTSYYL